MPALSMYGAVLIGVCSADYLPVRSARLVKSAISEEILRRYLEESISIASATSEIIGLPPLRIEGLRELIDAYRDATGSAAPPKNGAEDGEETAR